MPETIHICAGANERFMIGATAAFAGVAVNARTETPLHFHIFTEGVKPETVAFMRETLTRLHSSTVVEEHVCDEKLLAGLPYWAGSRLSAARVFYPYLLKNLDWVLYLDCDVLYFASPEEHWSYRDPKAYVCVTQEEDAPTRARECAWAARRCKVDIPDAEYFNAGVILFNLGKWRENKIPEKIQQFYKDYPDVALPDQTAMNALLQGDKRMLPARFDRLQIYVTDEKLAERPILHYVNGNPWLPKYGVVASRRFELWHRFCDRHVWCRCGESYRRCFSSQMMFMKRLLYWGLRTPCVSSAIGFMAQKAGFTSNWRYWRRCQIGSDCTSKSFAIIGG